MVINYLKQQKVNIIINNACQTIRPSQTYVEKVLFFEKYLEDNYGLEYDSQTANLLARETSNGSIIINDNNTINQMAINQLIPYRSNEIINYNSQEIEKVLEENSITFNQFHDIRDMDIKKESSWNKNIESIDPGEILEVNIINQIVPTLFINGLKPTMSNPKFIINVTALEGQFDCKKNSYHAHTNMCKAGINMLIRTMAEEDDPNLYVYTIDPGFVSGVNPQQDHYPLSAGDGASRILYPIIKYFNGEPLPKEWIKIRNYDPVDW